MKNPILEKHFTATSDIRDIQFRLLSLSRAFGMTGNTQMGEELEFLAERLSVSAEAASDAFGELIREDNQRWGGMIGNTLTALLERADRGMPKC